ncbi:hypothetical protein EST38_g2681 [Candolleomyces aberdarensis]|uniref:Fungal-type protein kinase domain-containing protein n=1 Tax=Candolleomyces aberdarensis TaxID=2316362 RepID=A0A4Q2DUY3_9AGAR|nr:hypothetical protein EST38_g2681 [Candolleomyces aberdarensis]
MPSLPPPEDNDHHQPPVTLNPLAELEGTNGPPVLPTSKDELAQTSPRKDLPISPPRVDALSKYNDENRPPTVPKPPAGLEDSKNPIVSPERKDKPAPTSPHKDRPVLQDLPQPAVDATVQERDDDKPKPAAPPSQTPPQRTSEPGAASIEGSSTTDPESPAYSPAYPFPTFSNESGDAAEDYAGQCPGSPPYRPESPTYELVIPLEESQLRIIRRDLERHTCSKREPETKSGVFAYTDVVKKQVLRKFLNDSPFYDSTRKTWKGMYEPQGHPSSPQAPTDWVGVLTEKFFGIISAVMETLGEFNGKRQLRAARGLKLFHEESESMINEYSSPTFVIQAQGPSFESALVPRALAAADSFFPRRDRVGFTNITTCIEIVSGIRRVDMFAQQAVYARQIFIQQPNRRFVRTLVITEEEVLLYHFDRSGSHCYVMPRCNPHIFVKIILGLSSLDEEVLGLDTSVQWWIDPETGRKDGGTLTIRDDESGTSKTYELWRSDPSFKQYCILGQGTTCWDLLDEENERLLLAKDCYRYAQDPDVLEFESLKIARGLDGLAQMVSYTANCGETLNDFGFSPSRKSQHNMTALRVVLEKNLLRHGTIHRDIHRSNIVHGVSKAKPGNQGVLIDFDMAKSLTKVAGENWAVGHTECFSIAILKNALAKQGERLLPHDHLDDMESKFYVTSTIMYQFIGPGHRPRPSSEFVRTWLWAARDNSCENMKANLAFKEEWILAEDPKDPIQHVAGESHWSDASLRLLEQFYAFTREMAMEKEAIRYCREDKRREMYDNLRSKVKQHYDTVLGFFDIAISTLEAAEVSGSQVGSWASGIKRPFENDSEEVYNYKRPCMYQSGELYGVST